MIDKSTLPLFKVNVIAAIIEPIRLSDGVPISKLKNSTKDVSIFIPSNRDIKGEAITTGSTVSDQWLNILAII